MELTDTMREAIRGQLTAKPAPVERPGVQRRTSAGLWVKPHLSLALGVAPEQIDDARAYLRSHGVLAEFAPDGRAILTSESQYRQIGKALGMYSGRDGWSTENDEGKKMLSGRKQADARREFERKVARGDYDF